MKFISGLFSGKKKNGNFFLELKDEPDEPMPKAVQTNNNGSKPAAAKSEPPKSKDTVKVKEEGNQVKEVASDQVKEVDVELIQTAEGVQAIAIPVDKKKAQKKAIEAEPKATTFAPKYLIPKNDNMRRRPGANMNSFLDMARQVKTPMK